MSNETSLQGLRPSGMICVSPISALLANLLDENLGIGRAADRQHFAGNRRRRHKHVAGFDEKRVPAWRFATDRGADAFISARKANRQGMPSRKDRPAAPAVKREAEEDWGGKRKASMTEPRRFPPPWTVGK